MSKLSKSICGLDCTGCSMKDRCYGLTADEQYLLVCENDESGEDAPILAFKRR